MDNLTHTLFGAAMGEAGLKRRAPLAMPALLIGANLPDIDIIAAFVGHSLSFRRGWTHGVLALVVLPVLLTAILLAWERWRRSRKAPDHPRSNPAQLLLIAFIGVLSHPFLDWLNDYGLRWLMPFDGTWFYGDALFIIDPWVWAALLTGVLYARRRRHARAAVATLAIVLGYIGFMLMTSAWARGYVLQTLEARSLSPGAVMVAPVPLDPFQRRVIVDIGAGYLTGMLHLGRHSPLDLDTVPVPRGDAHPAVRQAMETAPVRRLLTWSRFPIFSASAVADGWIVTADDLRYVSRPGGSFASTTVHVSATALSTAPSPETNRPELP